MEKQYLICKQDSSSIRWKVLTNFNNFDECISFLNYKIEKDFGLVLDKIKKIDKFSYKHMDTQYYILETNIDNAKLFEKIF